MNRTKYVLKQYEPKKENTIDSAAVNLSKPVNRNAIDIKIELLWSSGIYRLAARTVRGAARCDVVVMLRGGTRPRAILTRHDQLRFNSLLSWKDGSLNIE